MHSVFFSSKINLLAISHLFTFSKSVLIIFRLVSSANMEAYVSSKQLGKSLMYKDRNRPRFDPWGTPQ